MPAANSPRAQYLANVARKSSTAYEDPRECPGSPHLIAFSSSSTGIFHGGGLSYRPVSRTCTCPFRRHPPSAAIATLIDLMEGVDAVRWQDDDQLRNTRVTSVRSTPIWRTSWPSACAPPPFPIPDGAFGHRYLRPQWPHAYAVGGRGTQRRVAAPGWIEQMHCMASNRSPQYHPHVHGARQPASGSLELSGRTASGLARGRSMPICCTRASCVRRLCTSPQCDMRWNRNGKQPPFLSRPWCARRVHARGRAQGGARPPACRRQRQPDDCLLLVVRKRNAAPNSTARDIVDGGAFLRNRHQREPVRGRVAACARSARRRQGKAAARGRPAAAVYRRR